MRVVFFGTPEDAVPSLRSLLNAGHDVALVVTQPDRRRSRGPGADPSPVKREAAELGLAVATPAKAREVVESVRASGAELGVVVAFGQLLPVSLLEAVPHGFVNVHFSLLPRWRGAAPVERAILAGDTHTGVCLMRVEAGLDTGPVYASRRVTIGADETAGELRARLAALGADLLVEHLPSLPAATPDAQVGDATYADKLTVDEFRIDPLRTATELSRVVRAGNPKPGAWFVVDGRRVKVWRAHAEPDGDDRAGGIDARARLATADGALALDEVQPEGKRAMTGVDWRRGLRSRPTVDR